MRLSEILSCWVGLATAPPLLLRTRAALEEPLLHVLLFLV
jgi:hypothetical protein